MELVKSIIKQTCCSPILRLELHVPDVHVTMNGKSNVKANGKSQCYRNSHEWYKSQRMGKFALCSCPMGQIKISANFQHLKIKPLFKTNVRDSLPNKKAQSIYK